VDFNGDSLSEIDSEFEMFLKGCGFNFEGQLDLVDTDAN